MIDVRAVGVPGLPWLPGLPEPPELAHAMFGDRLGLARRYAERLAGDAVQRGLLGPREVPRLWERHLLNCAVVVELLPACARVIDVGSGAGLPGVALALARPDLQVELIEPMLRRVTFLRAVVKELGLTESVRVVRGRAPDVSTEVIAAPYVVSRALAPLDRLVGWCLPLLVPGGSLIAVKGERAVAELATHQPALKGLGVQHAVVRQLGADLLMEPTWAVVLRRRPPTGTRDWPGR